MPNSLNAESAPLELKPPLKNIIEKIDSANFKIGEVHFNKKNKEIRFPVELGDPDSIIEYLLVTEKGKTHETLLLTTISPLHLNLALKLLGYKESKELFWQLNEEFNSTGRRYEVSEETKKAARFDIIVSWKEGDQIKNVHVNELIMNNITKTSAAVLPYVYCGSYLIEGKLKAELAGDIIAIYTDPSALANFSNIGREDDTQWYPMKKRLPEKDTPLTLIIKKHNSLK